MAPRTKRDKPQQADPGGSQNGQEEDLARYEEELTSVLTERIKPGLNRGSIPLLARSIAKEIAHREHPRDVSEDDDGDDELSANEDDEQDADAGEQDRPDSESSLDLENDLYALQEKLGDDWVLYFSVHGGDAWLTAEKEDATQRVEAPNAAVLVKAVRLLNERGGRSAARAVTEESEPEG
jgi:hypothetical protein